MIRRPSSVVWTASAAFLLAANPVAAHEQVGVAGGLFSGFLHPLTGLDHLVAMVAVGIWGAQLGAPAIWILPITFPLVMALGGVLGVLHVPLPMPEVAIALSALVLGAAVAARLRVPFAVAAVIVAVFAIFHGHAHGVELPTAANPLAYGVGFVVATGGRGRGLHPRRQPQHDGAVGEVQPHVRRLEEPQRERTTRHERIERLKDTKDFDPQDKKVLHLQKTGNRKVR